MKQSHTIRMLLTGVCAMAAMTPAYAQEAEDGAKRDGDIVVTAQNREQDVTDVPIVIDVIGAEELKDAGFGSMNDVSKIAPVVQLNQDQGTVKVTLRGVGTNSNDEAQDTSVVVNIDGEYINRGNVLGSALFDMERVEVLRGPQGTLYGRNSTGGAINFITRKPGNEMGVDGSVSYGNYNAIRADAGVDLPLGGIGGIRVAGFFDERDGYISHPAAAAFGPFPAFAGGRTDDNKSYGGRVSLQLEPSEALTVNLAAEMARRDYTPQAFAAANLNAAGNGPTGPGCNAPGYVEVAPAYTQTLCVPSGTNFLSSIDRGEYAAPGFGIGQLGDETYAIRGSFSYQFGDAATLSYIGGYRSYSADEDDYTTLPISYRSYGFQDEARTQSHELRLNGTIGGVIYQVGAFYFKETIDSESGFMLPIGPNGTFLSYFGRYVDSDSQSVFGQVDVPVGDTITLVGGLRYTKNNREALYINATPFGAGPPDPGLFNAGPGRKDFDDLRFVTRLNLDMSEDKVTWLLGINFQPNDDTLVFAKASTGFKAGGFDSVGDYRPETNTAYEMGWKQTFGDVGQHQFNLGGYYYDYRDLQVSVLLDTAVGGQTFNAGKATIWGVEASANIALDDRNFFDMSVNYLNAEYNELLAQFNVFTVPGTGTDVNGIGDLDPTTPGAQSPNFAGNRPPFSPEWVITAGFEHIMPLGEMGKLTARVNTTFKSSYFMDFYNYQDGQQKALTQTDLSLSFKPTSGTFSITAFAKNLENARPLTYGSFVSAGPDDIYNWQFGAPRTYGVRIGFDF